MKGLQSQPWPEISPFEALDLPSFPTPALPQGLRGWVEAESHATQTPADLAALLALAVASSVIARRVVVQARSGYVEPTNLYVAVTMDPANRKSAVFKDALIPLRAIEAKLIADARAEVARAESRRRQLEGRIRKLEHKASEKGDVQAGEQAAELSAELAELPQPVLPRLIIDDATSEKVAMMLSEQGGRIASMSAEGGVFDLMAGLYSKSGAPQFDVYLKGHAGDDFSQDRVGRGSIRVESPAITCAYAIQPAVIKGLADKPAFRGRGLLARFLFSIPRSRIGEREIAPEPVPDSVREAYELRIRALEENCRNIGSASPPNILQLTADADVLFRSWEAEIEAMLAEGNEMETFRDWGGKLAGATLRLAAVVHCVSHSGPSGRIDAETMASAITIGRYLIPHAQAVLNMMHAGESKVDSDARYLLRWIGRHQWPAFTKSDAQHHCKRRFPRATDIDAPLLELTERGYLRPKLVEASGPGRPPSPAYEVNPAFLEPSSEKRSQYSHNSAGEPVSGNSRNNGSAWEERVTANP